MLLPDMTYSTSSAEQSEILYTPHYSIGMVAGLGVTLIGSTSVTNVAAGTFTDGDNRNFSEFVIIRPQGLGLWRVDNDGYFSIRVSQLSFGSVKRVMAIPRPSRPDAVMILIGQDLIIASVSNNEIFMKSFEKHLNCINPEFMSVDVHGSAVMVSTSFGQIFVATLNSNNMGNITIQSFVAINRASIIFSVVAIVRPLGEPPMFAFLEGCEKNAETKLVYYEHVDKDSNDDSSLANLKEINLPVQFHSNRLVPLSDGSIIVCGVGTLLLVYNHDEMYACSIPRRNDNDESPAEFIVVSTFVIPDNHPSHGTGTSRILMQIENGDVFVVDVLISQKKKLFVWYFDSLPPCIDIQLTRHSTLVCFSEFGDHLTFKVPSFSPQEHPSQLYIPHAVPLYLTPVDQLESYSSLLDFKCSDLLGKNRNQMIVACGRGSRSSLRFVSEGIASTVVKELSLSDSESCGPSSVWMMNRSDLSGNDSILVVSFLSTTLVLSVTETGIAEEDDDGIVFHTDLPTLLASSMLKNTFLQVSTKGIVLSQGNGSSSNFTWSCPPNARIVNVAANRHQVALVTVTGENWSLLYFEWIEESGKQQLRLISSIKVGDVTCLDFAIMDAEQQVSTIKSSWLIIGSSDSKVRTLSLKSRECLSSVSEVDVPHMPVSLAVARIGSSAIPTQAVIGLSSGIIICADVCVSTGSLTLIPSRYISVTSKNAPPSKPFTCRSHTTIKLTRTYDSRGNDIVMIIAWGGKPNSGELWMIQRRRGRVITTPISTIKSYTSVCVINTDMKKLKVGGDTSTGCVGASSGGVEFFSVWDKRNCGNRDWTFLLNVPLRYTPRRLCVLPNHNLIVLIESDYNCNPSFEAGAVSDSTSSSVQVESVSSVARTASDAPNRKRTRSCSYTETSNSAILSSDDGTGVVRDVPSIICHPWRLFQHSKPGNTVSQSCVRLIGQTSIDQQPTFQSVDLLSFTDNQAAISMCTCSDIEASAAHSLATPLICVGTASHLVFKPVRSVECGFVYIFRICQSIRNNMTHFGLELLFRRLLPGIPQSVCAFDGGLLVAVGRLLQLFAINKKSLVLRAEIVVAPHLITTLHVVDRRIFVGDVCSSITVVDWDASEISFSIVGRDDCIRWMISSCAIDEHHVAGSDRFGHVFVLELHDTMKALVTSFSRGEQIMVDKFAKVNSTANLHSDAVLPSLKWECDLRCHMDDLPTNIKYDVRIPNRLPMILFSTIGGAIGELMIIGSKEKLLLSELEHEIASKWDQIGFGGSRHSIIRSPYLPMQSVVDGDLCAMFDQLPLSWRTSIAETMHTSLEEIYETLHNLY